MSLNTFKEINTVDKPFSILVIEDSEPDFVLLTKALEKIQNIDMEIVNVQNGQEGIDYVLKEGKYANTTTPDLIILDLNLPIKSGFEVLEKIKNHEKYKVIPIVIYSTSDEKSDIHLSYTLYANSYITKTFDIKELFKKILTFGSYWINSVNLPDINYEGTNKKEK